MIKSTKNLVTVQIRGWNHDLKNSNHVTVAHIAVLWICVYSWIVRAQRRMMSLRW